MEKRATLSMRAVLDMAPSRPTNYRAAICAEAAEVYRRNCETAIGLLVLPGISALLSWDMVKAKEQTLDEVGDPLETNDPDHEVFRSKLNGIARAEAPWFHNRVMHFTRELDKIVPYLTRQSHAFYSGALQSVVVLSWTAFEELARTLWQSLRDSSNTIFRRPTEKERKTLRLGLESRSKIRNTFAFSFKCTAIDLLLSEDKIDPLALLRNVIVHAGCRADKHFLDDYEKFPQFDSLGLIKPRDPIQIDGFLVKSVVEPALESGYKLIEEIDNWIQQNP